MKEKKMLHFPDGSQLDPAVVLYITMKRNYAEFHLAGGEGSGGSGDHGPVGGPAGAGFFEDPPQYPGFRPGHPQCDGHGEPEQRRDTELCLQQKSYLQSELRDRKKALLRSMPEENGLTTQEDYHSYFRVFDTMPFAFTDIEMVFDEQNCGVDWIFRYGNPALAQLEKLPLETMIGASFGSLFANMDSKWRRSYERSALFGETLEIIDYSPEIDTYIKVICFPTFPGHCGCILFDVSTIRFGNTPSQAEKAMVLYLSRLAQ